MKTALQLTMYFVRNYGAVLQTHALQRVIDSIPGWKCMTLDLRPQWINGGWSFCAPSRASETVVVKRNLFRRLICRIVSVTSYVISRFRGRFVVQRWNRIFDDFLDKEIRLTRHYSTPDEFGHNPYFADIYITGSDQTFNPRFTKGELTWFWDFLPRDCADRNRIISYAASLGTGVLLPEYHQIYAKWLPKYDSLSLREKKGVDIVKGIGADAAQCCDPTMLLTREQWAIFAGKSCIRLRKPYVLCYNLRYAVNPYPMAEVLEEQVGKTLGVQVVHLQEAVDPFVHRIGRTIRYANPYDFVDLFFNASFIMTSSLHGTIFALLSGKPFLAYVNDSNSVDCRVKDLLETVSAEKHAVPISRIESIEFNADDFSPESETANAIDAFRKSSLRWLKTELSLG